MNNNTINFTGKIFPVAAFFKAADGVNYAVRHNAAGREVHGIASDSGVLLAWVGKSAREAARSGKIGDCTVAEYEDEEGNLAYVLLRGLFAHADGDVKLSLEL